uniref:DOCKER domain-containing protein n=1 Tax=Arcella intermedia TaxID=1963864 RepID=A0A6B2L2E6_9EUKA
MSYYQELAELTRLLTDENYMKQRIFSNYYRVAFYGKILGDEDGKEYIYKEPNTTMLTVFTEKLMIQFKSKYGNDNVIKLGNTPMNSSESDPSKLYIQIGAVETSFTEQEVPSRSSEWLKNYNLSRFVMDQPFTKSGAAQGSHEDQWIRRTTFVIDKALPFVEKRSLVKSKEWCDISPIENAISLIQGKIESLSSELNTSQPRIKILQRDLQGSLLTQVNAGPLAIASSFLSEENQNKYDEKLRITLADGLNKFSRTLTVAVKVNKKYIDQDQAVLQEALESALEKFKAELDKYPIFEQLRQAFEQEQAKQREEAENKGNSTLAQMNPNTPRRQTKDVVRSPNIKSAAAFKMAQRSGSLAVRADSPIGTAKKSTFFGSQRQSPASHALATLPLSAQPLEEDDEEKAPAPATDPAEAKAEEKKPEEKPEKKEATEGAKGSFSASYGSILVPVLPQGLPVRSATAPASEEKVPVVVPQADGPTAEIEEKSESAQAKKED